LPQTTAKRRDLPFIRTNCIAYAETLKNSVRSSPLDIDYPDHVRQIINVRMPQDWSFEDEVTRIDNPAFRYRSDISHKGRTATLDYDYQALTDHVEVDAIPRYQADRSKLNEDIDYRFRPDSAAAKQEPLAIAPAPLLAGLTSLLLSIWLMHRYVYRYDPPPRNAPPGAPSGIGGWLTLPALRCIAGPLSLLYIIAQFARFADASMWQTHAGDRERVLHPLGTAGDAGPTGAGRLLLPFSITASVLFFRKRTSAPALFVTLLAATATYGLMVIGTAIGSGIKDAGKASDVLTQLLSSVASLSIWSAYMFQSSRVKATFITRLVPPLPDAMPSR